MDWRWLLLSLGVAAVAAVRLRRHPSAPEDASPPPAPVSPVSPVRPMTPAASGPAPDAEEGPDAGPRGSAPAAGLTGDQGLDRSLDDALDGSLGRDDRSSRDDPYASGEAHPRPASGPSGTAPPAGVPEETPSEPVGPEAVGAALERIWAEHVGTADTLLESRLRLLVHRGVPARAIRPAPGTRTVRVVFADGTVVLCRGSGQGDFGRLGLAMLHHSVRLGSFRRSGDGTRLEFRWHPDQRLAAVAVGLDQPD